MISKDLLLITGKNKISIINENSYNLIRTIIVPSSTSAMPATDINGLCSIIGITSTRDFFGSGYICVTCILNKDIILTADDNKRIIHWKIENDNLKLISKKENAHEGQINTLSKLGNGLILSGGDDCTVKIW